MGIKSVPSKLSIGSFKDFPPLKMSVNISSVDFGTTDFVDYVLGVLREVELESIDI